MLLADFKNTLCFDKNVQFIQITSFRYFTYFNFETLADAIKLYFEQYCHSVALHDFAMRACFIKL